MTELEQVRFEWVENSRRGIPLGHRHEVLRVVEAAGGTGTIEHQTLVEAIGARWPEVTVAEHEQWIRDLHDSMELEQPTSEFWRVGKRGLGRLKVNRFLDEVGNQIMQLHSNVDSLDEYVTCLPPDFGPSSSFFEFLRVLFFRSETIRIRALLDKNSRSAITIPKLLVALEENSAMFCRKHFVAGDDDDIACRASHKEFDAICGDDERDSLDIEKLEARVLPEPPPESVKLVRKWVNKNVAHHEPESSPSLTVQDFRDCCRHLESCLKHLSLVIRNVGLTSATPTKQFDILEFARGVSPDLPREDREYNWRQNEIVAAGYRLARAIKDDDGSPEAAGTRAEAAQELKGARAGFADLEFD